MNRISKLWTNEGSRNALFAGLVAFAMYKLTAERGGAPYDQYVRLADSFLHGKVYIVHSAPYLEGAKYHGHLYSHQGVLPAILLVPFVAIFGPNFSMRLFTQMLGGGIGAAVWSLATRIGLTGRERILGWAFPILGTTFWYEAEHGTTWGAAALASGLFLFLALNEYFGKRRLPLIGLYVGLAAASRPPALLALVAFGVAILVTQQTRPTSIADTVKKAFAVGIGVLGPAIIVVGYNLLRFGTFSDISGHLHYIQDSYRTQVPPGMFAFSHVPFNLYSWFLLGPQFQTTFPYIHLSPLGNSLPLTSPAFVTAFASRRERWLWIGAVLIILPATFHYANGFTQFGMRYLLDAIPFLTTLIFLALKDDRAFGYTPLLAASIAINAYGVAYTAVYGLPY
jgi:hypothetical protein